MTPERWQHIRKLFEDAVERPVSERTPFLDSACADDADLRDRVEAMLAADAASDPFFDASLDHLAADLIDLPAQAPERVGPYRIVRSLGRGGMGQVYLARHEKGRYADEVALKVIRRGMDTDDILRRFRTEQHILAELDHPGIARLYEAGVTDAGRPYFAMEYLQGLPITTYCDVNQLSLGERLRLFCEVCAAVQHAHEHAVIHRDLKPGNIVVTNTGTVKLLDFGIAKVLDPGRLAFSLARTRTGARVMTPEYASPEQIRGDVVGPASDLYSLGVLLYEMLTGHRPYRIDSEAAHDIERIICEQTPERPSTAIQRVTHIRHADGTTTTVSPEIVSEARALSINALHQRLRGTLDALVLKVLHKDPQHRHASARELAQAIRHYLAHQPSQTHGLSIPNLFRRATPVSRRRAPGLVVAGVLAGIVGLLLYAFSPLALDAEDAGGAAPQMLAVLPFEHRGPAEQDYFADGMTDAITARLADLPDLSIIARSSAFQHKETGQTSQEIGVKLGADYVLEGTIQFEQPDDPNSRIRVIPQLIRVADNTSLWADTYEQDMANVFTMQAEIAEKVGEALHITLSGSGQKALQSQPTLNLEAYTYFLRGNEFARYEEDEERLRLAETMYKQAIERDSTFAEAYASLSEVHTRLWFYHFDHTDERLARGKDAAEQALIHGPDLAASSYALGYYYYYGKKDYTQALRYFEHALTLKPKDPETLAAKAYVLRRQGHLRAAADLFEQLIRLDPLHTSYTLSLAYTQSLLRDFAAARQSYARVRDQAPDTPLLYTLMAWFELSASGSAARARQVLEQRELGPGEDDLTRYTAIYMDLGAGTYRQALDRLALIDKKVFSMQNFYVPTAHLEASALRGLGDEQAAQHYEEEARLLLETYLAEHPGDARAHSMLGYVYARLGRAEDAIRAAERGAALMPLREDAIKGPFRLQDLAAIYTLVGEYDRALDQIEILLSHPGRLTIERLRQESVWAPLRTHSRFIRLTEPIS